MSMLAILVIILFIFSVIIHEISHGIIAYKFGDDTAYLSGRITLDPTKHIDPIMTIAVPLILYFTTGFVFGGAKPVPVNPQRFKNPRKNMMWVALAGPASNTLLAAIFAFGYRVSIIMLPEATQGSLAFILQQGLGIIVFYNLFLAFFNLIPVPPLDGGRIAAGLLPYELAVKYQKLEQYGLFIVFALIFTGLLRFIILPAAIFGEIFTGESIGTFFQHLYN